MRRVASHIISVLSFFDYSLSQNHTTFKSFATEGHCIVVETFYFDFLG